MGASLIGDSCKRKIWYSFRWAKKPDFDGRMLRLFETGHLAESRMVDDLRSIGCQVWDFDPDTGKQIRIQGENPHFSGSMDGIGLIDGKWRVLEFKTHSDKSFGELVKKGVKESKPQHYAQMQVYMYHKKIDRSLYFAVNKNTDDIYTEKVNLDKSAAKELIKKADEIIFSTVPPARLSDRPDWWECRFCQFRAICHDVEIPEKNCRTCSHVTPRKEGGWICEKKDEMLTTDEQKKGCGLHLFIPPMLELAHGKPVEAGETWVKYDDGFIDGDEN